MKIGIAGSGLLGRLIALSCIKQGYNVTLFDKDNQYGEQSCGLIAAGMVAPFAEIENTESIIFELGFSSLKLWPQLLQDLDLPACFEQKGSLLFAHPEDQNELLHFKKMVNNKLKRNDYLVALNNKELASLEPELALRWQSAFYLPDEAQVNTLQLFSACRDLLEAHKAKWNTGVIVDKVLPHKIYFDNQCEQFDWAIDCRGLGATNNFPQLRGVRGEVIELHATEVNLSRPIRLMHPRYSIYIVPRPNQHYIIGASSIESYDFSPISVRSTLELLSAAYSVHSGFAEARIINTRVNCRPALPDNLPKIKSEWGLLAINGLYRHGYLLAPALVKQAMALLGNQEDKI
jgi:glycine oxidase